MTQENNTKKWLSDFLARHEGVAGTVHIRQGDILELATAINIPLKVQELTAKIPCGKGMAGLAWERKEPVQTCNLKTDESGDVGPGAKAVDARAAVALPVYHDSGEVRAVIGIAFIDERDLLPSDLQDLLQDAATLL